MEVQENATTTVEPERLVKRQVSQQQQQTVQSSYYSTTGTGNYNQYGYAGQQIVTILAPVDSAFAALTSLVQGNQSAIDAILAQHIIVGTQNSPYYTEHDQSLFQNGQTYQTVAQSSTLTANVALDPKTNINSEIYFICFLCNFNLTQLNC